MYHGSHPGQLRERGGGKEEEGEGEREKQMDREIEKRREKNKKKEKQTSGRIGKWRVKLSYVQVTWFCIKKIWGNIQIPEQTDEFSKASG